jgi:hypothetical protein
MLVPRAKQNYCGYDPKAAVKPATEAVASGGDRAQDILAMIRNRQKQ